MLLRVDVNYEIHYEKAAEKFFRKHEDVRSQYIDGLNELFTGNNQKRVDVKVLKGKREKYYRMRIGDWRVIFAIIDGHVVVVDTLLAGSRGDIYKKMSGIQ